MAQGLKRLFHVEHFMFDAGRIRSHSLRQKIRNYSSSMDIPDPRKEDALQSLDID
ncbi:MAG: hypothetical protein LBI95_03770 [Holosporales bacterium]|nr:hypothetical protein [Holosporales bacterium]